MGPDDQLQGYSEEAVERQVYNDDDDDDDDDNDDETWEASLCDITHSRGLLNILKQTRNTFCGTWYLPHSHVHN